MSRLQTILFVFLLCGVALGASVEILPAIVSFDFIPPGYDFDMRKKAGVPIYIPNNNDVSMEFSVSLTASKPPDALLPGYENFPDLSWCRVEPAKVKVEPGDTGEVNLIFRIPPDSGYYNQYWELGVVVQSSRVVSVSTPQVQFGILPSIRGSYLISTTPKPGINPKGRLTGIAPSAAWLTKDEAIKGKELTFTIYNNDTVAHDYVIEPYEFPKFKWYDIRLAIQLFEDHKAGDIKWLKVSKGFLFFKKNTVHVEPGGSAEWTVGIKLPDTEEVRSTPGWDFVVKILPEGKKAHSGIFRITVQD